MGARAVMRWADATLDAPPIPKSGATHEAAATVLRCPRASPIAQPLDSDPAFQLHRGTHHLA